MHFDQTTQGGSSVSKHKQLRILALLMVVTTLLLSACGGTEPTATAVPAQATATTAVSTEATATTPAEATATTAAPATSTTGSGASGSGKLIAIITPSHDN